MKKMTRVERKRRRRRRISFTIIIIILYIIISSVFKRLDFFNVTSIKVQGNNILSKEEILKSCPLALGDNIFKFKKIKAEKNLMEKPYVKKARIRRKSYNKVDINIIERKESYIIQSMKGQHILIDDEGIILNILPGPKENCIYFSGEILEDNIKKEDLGKSIFETIKDEKIIEFLKKFNSSHIKKITSKINIQKDDIKFDLTEDREIIFGKLRNTDYKLDMLDEIIKQLDGKNILFSKILMDRGKNPVIIRQNNLEVNEIEEEG